MAKYTMSILLLQNEIITLSGVKEFEEKIKVSPNEKNKAFLETGLNNVRGWINEFKEAINLLNSEQGAPVCVATEDDR